MLPSLRSCKHCNSWEISKWLLPVIMSPSPMSSSSTYLGAHGWPEAAHRGPVQRPAPVPVPGGEAAAGEAEDGGAERADPTGRAQGPAVRGDLSPAESRARDRGQAERAGLVHSAPGKFSSYELHTQMNTVHLEVINSMMSQRWGWLRREMLSSAFKTYLFPKVFISHWNKKK